MGVKDDKWEMKGKLELDSGRYYLLSLIWFWKQWDSEGFLSMVTLILGNLQHKGLLIEEKDKTRRYQLYK